jgi:hypothetical protein
LILLILWQIDVTIDTLEKIYGELAAISLSIGVVSVAATGEALVYLTFLVLNLTVSVVLLKRRSTFARLWKAQAICQIGLPVAHAVWAAAMLDISMLGAFLGKAIVPTLATAFVCALCWEYLKVSIRVRNTFVE